MKVLTINTYAGSLILGAQAIGAEVVGSFEDSGYAVDVQKLNFGGQFEIVEKLPWPARRLQGTVVVAHPPCSAFSQQNNSAERKGVGTSAFECHRRVLSYATAGKADAIIIESVMGALEGARAEYDAYARESGYTTFRFLLNSSTMGLPQFRPRFWIVFVRDPRTQFFVRHAPSYATVRQVTDRTPEIEWTTDVDEAAARYFRRVLEHWEACGVPADLRDELLSGRRGHGVLTRKIEGETFKDTWSICKEMTTKALRILDLDGLAPVVLSDSNWMIPGRLLTRNEYKEIMGFPRDYRFPEKAMRGRYKEYLSKGVCPPVASWILEQVRMNLYGAASFNDVAIERYATHSVEAGGTLDLRPKGRKNVEA